MTSLVAAQADLLSPAPPRFCFSNPPPIGWWRAEFQLTLAAAAFVHYYQAILGTKACAHEGAHWEVDRALSWQAAAGITRKQWESVRIELSGSAELLKFGVRVIQTTKATLIRPSKHLLAIFGLNLEVYDAVVGLDWEISRQLSPYQGPASAPARPVSPAELSALALWAARGGLERMPRAEQLAARLTGATSINQPQDVVHVCQ